MEGRVVRVTCMGKEYSFATFGGNPAAPAVTVKSLKIAVMNKIALCNPHALIIEKADDPNEELPDDATLGPDFAQTLFVAKLRAGCISNACWTDLPVVQAMAYQCKHEGRMNACGGKCRNNNNNNNNNSPPLDFLSDDGNFFRCSCCGGLSCGNCMNETEDLGLQNEPPEKENACNTCPQCLTYDYQPVAFAQTGAEPIWQKPSTKSENLNLLKQRQQCQFSSNNCTNQAVVRELGHLPSCRVHFDAHKADMDAKGLRMNPTQELSNANLFTLHHGGACACDELKYCNPCNVVFCSKCDQPAHGGHQTELLKDIASPTVNPSMLAITRVVQHMSAAVRSETIRFDNLTRIEKIKKGMDQFNQLCDKKVANVDRAYDEQRNEFEDALEKLRTDTNDKIERNKELSRNQIQSYRERVLQCMRDELKQLEDDCRVRNELKMELLDRQAALRQLTSDPSYRGALLNPDPIPFAREYQSRTRSNRIPLREWTLTAKEIPPSIFLQSVAVAAADDNNNNNNNNNNPQQQEGRVNVPWRNLNVDVIPFDASTFQLTETISDTVPPSALRYGDWLRDPIVEEVALVYSLLLLDGHGADEALLQRAAETNAHDGNPRPVFDYLFTQALRAENAAGMSFEKFAAGCDILQGKVPAAREADGGGEGIHDDQATRDAWYALVPDRFKRISTD